MRKKITAHTIVKNEANFVWYSLNCVFEYMDEMLIWDTGSTDGTWEIIQEFRKKDPQKIKIERFAQTEFDEQKIRKQMLDETKTDWFMVLDGDEIWWDSSIKKVCEKILTSKKYLESIVVPTVNLVGDMYHYQGQDAGNYHLAGKVGHYNLRFINRQIPGLSSDGSHGVWGWVDEKNKMIQNRQQENILYMNAPYLHATHLQRSGIRSEDFNVYKRSQKLKHELGTPFPLDYYYPESFFMPKPDLVPNVWKKMNTNFFVRSVVETPLRKIKRNLLPKKIGY